MAHRYVFDQHSLVADFVARMIPHVRHGFGNCTAIGVVNDDDELIAGVVYHHHSPEDGTIAMSGAALSGFQWLTRGMLRVMYEYPFLQLRCQMVIMNVPASNRRLLRQLAAGGYRFVTLPRLFGREEDGVYCCLTEEDWRASRIIRRLYQQPNKQIKAA
jgi:RimJ/RimL family protein N-acetyltransferase